MMTENNISDWLKGVIDFGIYFIEESEYQDFPFFGASNYKTDKELTKATRGAINITNMLADLTRHQPVDLQNYDDYE